MTDTPFGSILDVEGIRVGHHDRRTRGWSTGTTVVACRAGATPGVDVRGGGPGTRETDALRPEHLVDEIHATCLTGGSAYGLVAAHGVMGVCAELGLGFPVGEDREHVVPVVPAAVIYDLGRGGRFANHPDAEFGRRAARAALAGRQRPRWGSVGAGTGARAGGLQGGVGTASRRVVIPSASGDDGAVPDASRDAPPELTVTVGAVAVVNAHGSIIDPDTALPWEAAGLPLRRPGRAERDALRRLLDGRTTASDPGSPAFNTTIGVIATSARLDKAESARIATVGHDGLARAVRPAHSMVDGDTVFSLATGAAELSTDRPARVLALNQLLAAAADVFALACTHAIVTATAVGDAPAWRDLCASALR